MSLVLACRKRVCKIAYVKREKKTKEKKERKDFIKQKYLHKRSLIPWAHAVLKFGSNKTTANSDNA